MSKIYCIIYTSSASEEFSFEQASYITDVRRDFCRKNQVSGLLVYGSGNFLRLIQGDYDKVLEVFRVEKLEAPQFDIIKLFEGYTNYKYFEDHPLAVKILGTKHLKPIDNFQSEEAKEYFEECLNADEMPIKILREFISNNK